MSRIIVFVCWVLVLLGCVFGPGYAAYCHFFSGNVVGEYELFSYDVDRIGTQGIGRKMTIHGDGSKIPPVVVNLSPEMNPIALNIKGLYIPPVVGVGATRVGGTTSYQVLVHQGTKLVFNKKQEVSCRARKKDKSKGLSLSKLEIGKVGSKSFSYQVGMLNVVESGEYNVKVNQIASSKKTIYEMKLKVRRNISIIKVPVCASGCTVLGLGMLGLIIIGIKRNGINVSN